MILVPLLVSLVFSIKFSYHYLNYTAFVFIILKNILVHLFYD